MKTKIFLTLIVTFAFIVRFYQSSYPPLLWDEASLGYNAYSILKTGKDEYGQFLPLIFKSFGDYKPGAYVYLTVPFVALFGLSATTVRLPSIILGSLLPLLTYLLIVTIKPNQKKVGLIAAALIAFNPWNIHFSRGAWETNILTFELVLASYLFFKQKHLLSALIFGLTLYTYQGAKLISLLLIIILFIVNFRQINFKKFCFSFGLPLFLLTIPILIGLIFNPDANRLQVVSLLSYPRDPSEVQQITKETSPFDYQIFHQQANFFIRGFMGRYFNHFSPNFLFSLGDWQIGRHSAPYIGVILYPSLVFLIIGLFSGFTSPYLSTYLFFLLWLLVAPLPAALTRDQIQPVRAMSMSIPLMYFAALGIYKMSKIFKLLPFLLIPIYLLSFIYYSDLYLNHMAKTHPDHWLYGYTPAMNYALSHQVGKTVYFSDFYGQPYIYYLFYSQYDPSKYQQQAKLTLNGLDTGKVEKIDNFNFETPNFQNQKPHQLQIFTYDDAVRQGIDLKKLIPLSPVNTISTFYAYETN